jgi:hypothetical protein
VLPHRGAANGQRAQLTAEAGDCVVTCGDGERLCVLEARNDQGADLRALQAKLAGAALPVS